MSLPDKKLERLNQLLSAFDDGAIQPDELNQALEAVMTVIESANRELDQRINKSSENATGALSALENRVSQATSELQALIRQVKAEETTDKEELRKMVAAELLRIESKIPQLPEQFDASGLYNEIQSHKEMLTGLSELIVGENIRNALEALPEGEKLVMEAIEGLPELLEKLSQMEGKGNAVGGVTRALVEQLIAESGGGSSLPDQTGNAGKFLNTDGTDATWESIPGGGDMLAATYDPAAGAKQVAFNDELHAPVTVTDTTEVDLTLTGQAISAALKAGSIAKARLVTAVQTSLGKADTATQPGDLATVATSGDYDDLSNKPDLSAFDNISEHANATAFPGTGAADKFYLAQDTGILYRWTGSAYTVISAELALGETSSTAYRGDRGATAFAHVSATDNPHSVSKAQVGLSNVPNTDFTSSIAAKVSKTGNETVAGVKTFSSSPIIPAPSTDLQAATKKYVDDNGGGGGGITWSEVTGTTQAASVNAGYIANNAGLVTITIPTTAAVGDVVRVTGKGAGGWKIAQNASEIIHFLGTDTTTGTGGSLASTGTYDGVEIVCVVANTEWVVISSMGNITIV